MISRPEHSTILRIVRSFLTVGPKRVSSILSQFHPDDHDGVWFALACLEEDGGARYKSDGLYHIVPPAND